MQLLQPLAIFHICFTPRQVLGSSAIDETDLESMTLKDFMQRDPINTGRFHRHGFDSAATKPDGSCMQIRGETSKHPHWIGIPSGRHCHTVLCIAYVNPAASGLISGNPLQRSGLPCVTAPVYE
jgi:hypothetical protein